MVFNSLNGSEEYILFVKGASDYLAASIINKQDNSKGHDKLHFKSFYGSDKKKMHNDQEPVKVELWRYHNPKGPPVLC